MTRVEALEQLRRSMEEMFELDRAALVEGARLAEDLDLDSIDAVDLAARLHDLTGRRVGEKELRAARTIGDLADLAVRLFAEG